jgi:hypothetical protein
MTTYKYILSKDSDAELKTKIDAQAAKLKNIAAYRAEDNKNENLIYQEEECIRVGKKLENEKHMRELRTPTDAHVNKLTDSLIHDMIDSKDPNAVPNAVPLWYTSGKGTFFFSVAQSLYSRPIVSMKTLVDRVSGGRKFRLAGISNTLQFTPTGEPGRFSVLMGGGWQNVTRNAWADPSNGAIVIQWQEGYFLYVRPDRNGKDGLFYDDSVHGGAYDMN